MTVAAADRVPIRHACPHPRGDAGGAARRALAAHAFAFSLDHVNLWLLDEHDIWTVVDCGISDEARRHLWSRVFSTALAGKPVRRVIATHMHPDHLTDRKIIVACDTRPCTVCGSGPIGEHLDIAFGDILPVGSPDSQCALPQGGPPAPGAKTDRKNSFGLPGFGIGTCRTGWG